MQLLTSFCNLRAPGVPALGLFDPIAGEFHVLQLPAQAEHFGGITGLTLCDRYVYMAAQPSEASRAGTDSNSSVLLILNRRDLSLAGRYAFRMGTDIHSLLAHEGRLFAVSTGTDDVLELALRDAEVISETSLWRPTPDAQREDLHHLNAIMLWNNELIVSGFGKKTADQWSSARKGFVRNITTGETLAADLDQPHSLVNLGDTIACCESRKRLVREIGGERVCHLPGYARGLAHLGDHLYVATSVGRQVSRSTGLINNPADDGVTAGQCTINHLSMATFEIEHAVDLGLYAYEIYDLLAVDQVAEWPIAEEIQWRNSCINGLSATLDRRTAWAKRSTLQKAQLEIAVDKMRQELLEQGVRERDIVTQHETLAREASELRTVNQRQQLQLEALTNFVELARRVVTDSIKRPDENPGLKRVWEFYRILQIAAESLPPDGITAVVSKGDDELLKAIGRRAWHFPQTIDGVYAGTHPVNSLAAIAHLEALRIKGADFIIFPSTSFWWLEYYGELEKHLNRRYRELVRDDECVIFDLREIKAADAAEDQSKIEKLLARLGGDQAVLDWNTGLELVRDLKRQAVFSPPSLGSSLPYLDQSVDVVVAPNAPASLAEARRVASSAVIKVSPSQDATSQANEIEIEWQAGRAEQSATTVSIICLVDNARKQTKRYRAALEASLPDDFAGEILWLDPIDSDADSIGHRPGANYAAACNRAAARAQGEILIFLDRLTTPLNGWLAPLLEILNSHPRIGVVGGKVLSSDARLAAAGGAVFSDGSLAGFGNGDYMINDPLYDYVRTTDDCGDAMLATRRTLFNELAGFDIEYASPAYVHSDFCFRAREHGFQTCFQPESRLVSLSEDADGAGFQSPIIDLNSDRELFQTRWKQALKHQPLARRWRDRDTWHALALHRDVAAEARL